MNRIVNEIYFASTYEEIYQICNKLDEVKDCELGKEALFNYICEGLKIKKAFPFASYDDGMNGCIVLTIAKTLFGDLAVTVVFVWIDKKYPDLWEKYLKFVEDVAEEIKANRIIGSTMRKGAARKLEEFGYKETYRIIEKKIGNKEEKEVI